MNMTRRGSGWCLAAVTLVVVAASGCQTWVGGMSLPSPSYLEHPPQYIPSQPGFPFAKEEMSMEAMYRNRSAPGTAAANGSDGVGQASYPAITPSYPGTQAVPTFSASPGGQVPYYGGSGASSPGLTTMPAR